MLRCAPPPGGWQEPALDSNFELPDLSFVALTNRWDWVVVDLSTGEASDAFSGLGSISRSRDGSQLLTQHVNGLVRGGDLSADGQWRVFGLVPQGLQSPRLPTQWIRNEVTGTFAHLPIDDDLEFRLLVPVTATEN